MTTHRMLLWRRRWSRQGAMLFLAAMLAGCGHLDYYRQAVSGHFELWSKRQPIVAVLAAPETSEEVKRKLELALDARRFASEALMLPENDSYRMYVDLGRDYVVWNVFATPELSLEPVESCFVIVGCLDYRGYFRREDAYAYGAGLESAGYDVWVAGVAAYSTLGWFDDPVLNTMIRWEDARLVKVIFHELAHQVIYVSDDTEFNESFATAVADIGYQRWAATSGGATASVDESVQRDAEFHRMLLAHRERLADIYGSAAAEQRKREQKAAVFAAIYADYRSLKDSWQGYDGYDDWMTDLNNAKLAAVATYHVYVPVFQTILEVTGGDLQVFFAVAREFARRSSEYRDTCMTRQLENADGSAVDCIDELVESARSAAR